MYTYIYTFICTHTCPYTSPPETSKPVSEERLVWYTQICRGREREIHQYIYIYIYICAHTYKYVTTHHPQKHQGV